MTLEDVEKKLTDLEVDLGTVTKRADRAEAIIKIGLEDREVFDELSKEDQDQYLGGDTQVLETAREETLAKADKPEQMPEEIQKRFDDIQKKLNDANAEIAKANLIAKSERDRREDIEFAKQAETELSHLPGEANDKGKILKACSGKLSKEEFEGVTKLFEAGNSAMKQLGTAVGKDATDVTSGNDAYGVIEKKARALQASDKITFEKAFDRVITAEPALYDKFMAQADKK